MSPRIGRTRKRKPAAIGRVRQEELTSLRRVVRGLAWVSRYVRLDFASRVNEL